MPQSNQRTYRVTNIPLHRRIVHKSRILAILAGALIAPCILAGALWIILVPLSEFLGGRTVAQIVDPDKRANAINAVRQTILAAIGGTAALIGLAYTCRTFYLTRRGQLTERFSKAVTALSSSKLADRLGGIFELEHIMRESASGHNTVVDILTTFIREHAALDPELPEAEPSAEPVIPSRKAYAQLPHPTPDVQAALKVLGRRPLRPERLRMDLTNTDLRGVDLREARFKEVFLTRCRLDSSYLRGADLRGAVLADACLNGANLRDVTLDNADIDGAKFRNATFSRASLKGVKVASGQLTNRQLKECGIPAIGD